MFGHKYAVFDSLYALSCHSCATGAILMATRLRLVSDWCFELLVILLMDPVNHSFKYLSP